jgi:hypothetical protein
MSQEVIEITEREIEIIEVVERGPAGPTGPQANINYTVVSSPQTLSNSQNIAADTSGGTFTLTLPLNPNEGDSIDIFDYSETFDTNPLTIARNGQRIESLEENLICNVEGAYFTMIYTGVTRGWQILPRYGTSGGGGESILTNQGDTLYRGALVNERLPIGTAGQILKVSSGGIPEWGAPSASGVSSVNGETGAVTLDGSDIDTSGNDDSAAFFTYEFEDGNGLYYPLPDSTLNNKRVYRTTTGHHVFFQSLRWHITDGSPITANIIESSDDDNAAWPWLSAWDGSIEKAKLSTIVGRARSTFLFVGDSVPSTSVSGLGTAATSDSTAFASASHTHGNLTNDGKIGTTANLPLITGTNGVIEAGSFGTAAGSFCAGDDARLSDARTPSSTLAHKTSHSIGGTDALAPSDIGAQSIFARSEDDVPASGPLQLSAARAAIVSVRNARSEARDVYLPMTSIQNGDIIVVVGGGTLTNPINIKVPAASGAAIVDPNGGAVTISVTGQQYRFIVDGVGNFIPWTRVNVDTHTHVVADVTGAAASGSITASGLTQATARILGRTTASTGAVEEIQIGSGLSLSAGELSATGGSGGGEVRSDFVSPYTYTGLADAGTSESTASWTIRRSEFDAGGSFVATLTASSVEWDDRLTASYA